MGKLTIIPSATIIELVLSIYAVVQSEQGHNNRCLLQTVHVLALWNIQIALQLFTMVIIVLLLIHPQETIFVSLLFVIVTVNANRTKYRLYRSMPTRTPRSRQLRRPENEQILNVVAIHSRPALLGIRASLLHTAPRGIETADGYFKLPSCLHTGRKMKFLICPVDMKSDISFTIFHQSCRG